MSRRLVAPILVALAIAAIVLWYARDRAAPTRTHVASPTAMAPTDTAGQTATATGAPGSDASSPTRPIDRVSKLDPDQRKQLADRIAAARAGRAATSAAIPPSLPSPVETDLQTSILAAMKEVMPFLVQCHERATPTLASPNLRVVATMMLLGDPDIGTLIDAHAIVGPDGKPLPAAFDDCLRSTLQSLQLPPLDEGSEFKVNYSFVFASDGPSR